MHLVGRCFLISAFLLLALVGCAATERAASVGPIERAAPTTTSSPSTPTAEPTATLEAMPEPTVAPPPVWAELASTDGPAAREDHTWRVDDDGATAYLFGGRDG